MKLSPLRVIILILTVAFFFACSEKKENQNAGQTQQEQPAQPGAQPDQPAQPPSPGGEAVQPRTQPGETPPPPGQEQPQGMTAPPEGQSGDPTAGRPSPGQQVEIAGKVEQTPQGIALRSANESYMVSGRDLSDMVGKEVKVTGFLEEAGGRMTINVSDIQEIR